MFDHQIGKFGAVYQHNFLALDPVNEVEGILRELRCGKDHALLRPDVVHAADEALNDGPTHGAVPSFSLETHHVEAQLVFLDDAVDSSIATLPCVTTYGGMIKEYARQKGLRRWLISVPVLTPYLSSLWLALVTPASFEVGRHLIEGLKNPTVVRDTNTLEVLPIRPMGIREAIQKALASTK
jgi:hypothetical protein